MNIKIGYYPLFDMLLALRQLFSGERFKPFTDVMESIESKLIQDEKDYIQAVGDETRGWLKVIAKMIDAHIAGMTNTEEIILKLLHDPSLLFNDMDSPDREHSELFLKLWQSHFSNETSKHSKILLDKSLEINNLILEEGAIPYLTGVSDRVQQIDSETLKFMIKPNHEEKIDDIENIIIMPSVFAVRNLTFWHSGRNYVFFISLNETKDKNLEPSDNLLLKTMALNDKTRLKMLKILGEGHCSSMEMAEKLEVNPSTVSRHFKLFKDAGFVEIFNQEGNTVYYTLNKSEIQASLNMIYKFIDE